MSFAVALAVALFAAVPAAAQGNAALAESLFRDGKKLLLEKKYDEACPKFAESARLDPSSGVELALGICYEGQGKLASAWGAYVLTISLARRDSRHDREKAAAEHAADLETKLSRVTLAVSEKTADLPGVEVREDGVLIGREAWKNAPLDPGEHDLEVTAPGKKPYKASFTLQPGTDHKTVGVPELEDGEPSLPAKDPNGTPPVRHDDAEREGGSSPLRPLGFAIGAAGIASVGVGSVLGLLALSKANAANRACPASLCTDAQAVSENGTAGTMADLSTVTLVAGGAAVVAGALLVLLAPSSKGDGAPAPATSRLVPLVGPGAVGLRYAW